MEEIKKNDQIISDPEGSEKDEETGKEAESEIETERLKTELAKKKEELSRLHDKYLRICAEFENYKKRNMREQIEFTKYANEKILKELLPVIDNLERAISHSKETNDLQGLIEGIELTYKHFLDSLSRFGIKVVQSVGEPFDPSRHQAIGQIESDEYDENIVAEELQKGYLLEERVLRPALVNVYKKKASNLSDN